LSSAGWRTKAQEQYPAVPLLERFLVAGVPMTTASDAHQLDRVSERMEDLGSLAASVGLLELASFEGRVRTNVPLEDL